VFEESPEGMGEIRGLLAADFRGDVGGDGVKGGMGMAALEKFDEMLAEGFVVVGHRRLI
jgi:hypothetical protein